MAEQQTRMSHEPRVAALMACHNRVSCTVQSVSALKGQICSGVSLDLVLVDDGSSDGTAHEVAKIFPNATILCGDGSLFWSGGVRWAFSVAMQGDYDFYLWLNDDTHLDQDALARLTRTYREVESKAGNTVIVVGSTRDPETGLFSYGGWRQRPGRLGLTTWEKTPPDMEHPIPCDTINGNCALIPRAVVQRVGNLDPVFSQGFGDLDYGLRAAKSGCQIMIAPGYFGTCKNNEGAGMWTDKSLPIFSRWQKLLGPKGLPVKPWGVFTRRHKGRLWPLSWIAPYVLFWFTAFSPLSRNRK